jgi:ParB-like chromosome segregation protein Spo0J
MKAEQLLIPLETPPEDPIAEAMDGLLWSLRQLPPVERIEALNRVRRSLHEVSPFRHEPMDLVEWVEQSSVVANDYNPNAVAPPEMKLLEVSILADGYTQPIVVDRDADAPIHVVVDGFHRNRIGRESEAVKARVLGYLPVVQIRNEQKDRPERIASTIRHNRARGRHQVEAMSQIVLELKRRNWSDEKIGGELGMDPDEVLRLAQITGLAEAFKDREFSKAWETDLAADDESILELAEQLDD